MEQQIKLAARLYECRDTAKKLYREEYGKKMLEYQHLIKAAMKKHQLADELKAAMKLIEECKHLEGNGAFTMNVLAAYVELIEPSK